MASFENIFTEFKKNIGEGAMWYSTTGLSKKVTPRDGKIFSLNELQIFVGGYIETMLIGEYIVAVNEEGLLRNLPPNEEMENLGMQIVGDVVIMHNSLLE